MSTEFSKLRARFLELAKLVEAAQTPKEMYEALIAKHTGNQLVTKDRLRIVYLPSNLADALNDAMVSGYPLDAGGLPETGEQHDY